MNRSNALLLLSSACLFASTAVADGWEIKTDLKYTDGATSDVTTYDGGSFDKRKIKKKRKTEVETLLTYTAESRVPELEYIGRVGHLFKRNKDRDLQLKEDGSLKKDKTRTEFDRITYAGFGLRYDTGRFLGADRWLLKARYDRYLHVSYGANMLHEDAKARSGDLTGYEWAIKASGEYSTPSHALYLHPFFEFKQERLSLWHDDKRDKIQEAEMEQQYEAGLFLSWITPVDGWELIVGPYWQRELDAERAEDEVDWTWDDDERWIAHLKLEYEAPISGFEMEISVEEHLNGGDEGERRYNLELSYEF